MRGTSRIVLLAGFLAIAPTASYADADPWQQGLVPLTHHDYKVMDAARKPLLIDDSLPIGATREWINPRSGNHGTIQLMKRFEYEYQGSKLPCRELRYHVVVKGNADPYNFTLNRCKVADGSWKIL